MNPDSSADKIHHPIPLMVNISSHEQPFYTIITNELVNKGKPE